MSGYMHIAGVNAGFLGLRTMSALETKTAVMNVYLTVVHRKRTVYNSYHMDYRFIAINYTVLG